MKIAVFGTGMVGTTIANKLLTLGHEVTLGGRTADSEHGLAWMAQTGSKNAKLAAYGQAAQDAELVFNATRGDGALAALTQAGDALSGKIVIDISNPLDFSQGMPPRLTVCNDTSLAEQLQAAFPQAKFVKTLNTVTAQLMVHPAGLPQDSAVFMSGNDTEAKAKVESLVLREWFGWKQVIDLGDITTARGTEMYLPLWVRLYGALQSANFNIAVVRGT